MSETTSGSKGLVLLDASTLERCYLRVLLRGEECRDVRSILEHGYTPAVLQKTLAEVWAHAKLGGGNVTAWGTDADYPGSIDRMVSAIERADPDVDARRTAWLWLISLKGWTPKNGTTGRCRSMERAGSSFIGRTRWKRSVRECAPRSSHRESSSPARGILSSGDDFRSTVVSRLNPDVLFHEDAMPPHRPTVFSDELPSDD